jgi:hypothetical protein
MVILREVEDRTSRLCGWPEKEEVLRPSERGKRAAIYRADTRDPPRLLAERVEGRSTVEVKK